MRVCSSIESTISGRQGVRRQHARRVAGVDPSLLDVLHHAADDDALAIGHAVDVDLDRVLQELVDQDVWVPASRAASTARWTYAVELVARVRDHHRAPAEHVARPHEDRVADAAPRRERLLGALARCRCAAA